MSIGRESPKTEPLTWEGTGLAGQPREWPMRWEQNQEVRGLQSREKSFRKEGERTKLAKKRLEGGALDLL